MQVRAPAADQHDLRRQQHEPAEKHHRVHMHDEREGRLVLGDVLHDFRHEAAQDPAPQQRHIEGEEIAVPFVIGRERRPWTRRNARRRFHRHL